MFTTKIFIFPSETIEQTQKSYVTESYVLDQEKASNPSYSSYPKAQSTDHEITTERTIAFFKKR